MTKRVFRLQFSEDARVFCKCGHCHKLGLISPFTKVKEDFIRSLRKLDYELIDTVLMPCFARESHHFSLINENITTKNLVIINDGHGLRVTDLLHELDETDSNILILSKELFKDKKVFKRLKAFKGELYFYSPRKKKFFDEALSLRKLYKFFLRLKKENILVQTYPGLSLWEDRAPIDLCFEPYISEKNLLKHKRRRKLSVIIPVFEQKKYLLNTLRALDEQDIMKDDFEIIIVDDGGDDQLEKEIKTLNSSLNVIYEYFPRAIKRTMGDFRFRAGISRNLGYRLSKSEYLFFLDADVLLPQNALSQMLKEIEKCDILQIQRLDLTEEATKNCFPLNRFNKKDIIKSGREYWYDFFEKAAENWNGLEDPWKYVCTYGLMMKTHDFEAIGGFYNNYIGYGFEDTDLGIRMFRKGARFKLSQVVSYHQFHDNERSEFKNGQLTRKKILSRTAKTFFLNHLDPEIYCCLRDYM